MEFSELLSSQIFTYLPKNYIQTSQTTPIKEICDNQLVTIFGIVTNVNFMPDMLIAKVSDETGAIDVIYFKYNNFHKIAFRKGHRVLLVGKVKDSKMVHPKIIREEINNGNQFKATYSQKMNKRKLNKMIENINDESDPVPEEIRQKRGIPSLRETARMLHFPQEAYEVKFAKWCMAYRELYDHLSKIVPKYAVSKNPDVLDITQIKQFVKEKFPFKLTQGQQKAIREILQDMTSTTPMRRILFGDVGAGKTEVAIVACAAGAQLGRVMYLCPTEILAIQTYQRVAKALGYLYSVGIYKSDEKKYTYRILVGTHSLLNKKWVGGERIALAVIDEQHKFGVQQRSDLISNETHLLEISATPIPRSYALFLQNIMDVSILETMPYQRKINTVLITNKNEYNEVLEKLDECINNGKQALIIYPAVESETNGLQSVLKKQEYWKKRYGEDKVDILYGGIANKDKILKNFSTGKTKILISTLAAEVGIDIPDLTMCIVVNAERFGLISLHQIRGRLSRRGDESYFYLICKNKNSIERIIHLVNYDNGFDIAEVDMQLRGVGEIGGKKQSGHYFRFFSFKDSDIIEKVKEDLFFNKKIA